MAQMYYENDADLNVLKSKTIAVLGFGSQGHAQAQNLKDSGLNVIIGLRENSKSKQKAEAAGLEVLPVEEAVKKAQVIQILLPDEAQPEIYEQKVKPNLDDGDALGFSHGFNIHYSQVVPPKNVDVFMIAPKGPGHLVRETYERGEGVPGLLAIYQDYTGKSKELALSYAKGVGCTRGGLIETSFEEETETDLFGEQAVLCGGASELVKAGYETLVEAGYQEEVAYFECLHELKLIVDLMYEGGLSYMRHSISDTAQYGDMTRGKKIVDEESKKAMRKILEEVQDGTFAKEWILENKAGRPMFNNLNYKEQNHSIEQVGKELRKMMSWISDKKE
ncbi:ketol-acid reductoisomerase [Natranaerofaba carboxydovora]|uniref:ketol-acid reductoisomerase n=1 Tax=Natranaerofaba carboxydovora TaxID=2742683 RepID=UPI001F147CA9|nr:ketol-acid reductoisomerase [Natranaerofaba carboxydovora]UMZ75207.1 Ketol-acid reductoisomerase (NAD(P)(+)) [Natranaerofaba carboxydovora]